MTKLNYLDAEEMQNWLKDRLDDREASDDASHGYEITAEQGAAHIMRSMEQEGLAILPTDGQWPPVLSFKLGDEVEYSTCGGPSCHKIRARVVGWFRHETTRQLAGQYGYVLCYGTTTQVVAANRVTKYEG